MKIQGKRIIVTGAGGGIGRELAAEIVRRGGEVIAVDNDKDNLEKTVALSPEGKIKPVILDITDTEKVFEFAKNPEYVTVDSIINNAGIIQPFVPIADLKNQDINRVMAVNFYGTLNLVRAFLPVFLQKPEAHIVNLSSMGGFLPVPGQGIYGAAKAAVKLMTEALHGELRHTGVKVTVVFPGAVRTNIKANSGLKEESKEKDAKQAMKILSPEKAARKILDGMEKNRARIILGKDARLMDFLYRLSPNFASGLIAAKMADKLN